MTNKDKFSRYLGDGLYAEYDGHQIRLFTPLGEEVFLDMSTFGDLLKYAAELHPILKNIIKEAAEEIT
jgi:hypothetical protein